MQRRNRVEGFFGNMKDEARESIRRGVIRVRGREKIGVFVALAIASLNVRLTESFRHKQANRAWGATVRACAKGVKGATTGARSSSRRGRGRPKKQGLGEFLPRAAKHLAENLAAANAPPGG